MNTVNNALLCNNFGGIRRVSSSFSSSLITASDIQNVELFDTGINSGVGIRTMKGNTSVLNLPDDEKIINIFKSVQKTNNYLFIHTENEIEGKIYLYDIPSKILSLKKDGLSLTGVSCGVDFAFGWSDLFIFSNGEELLSIELENRNQQGELDEVRIIDALDCDGNKVKGLGLVVFDGRLWLFNKNRLIYSVKENCYDFSTSLDGIITSAGFIQFPKNITAICKYISALAVFHEDSSCMITIASDYNYARSEDSPGGCSGMESLVFHGSQLYFYDNIKKSLFAFSQIINGEKTLVDNLAKDLLEEFCAVPNQFFNNIKLYSVIDSLHNEIWIVLPTRDDYSVILIYDYIHSQWVKRKSQKINSLVSFNDELYSAGGNKLFKEYEGDDFDGEFIESFYTCSPMNLNIDNAMKILYIPPRLTLDMNYTNHFMLQYTRDYDALNKVKYKEIFTKTIKNIFRWDVSLWDSFDIFKPKETNSIKRLPISCFKTLEMKFYTSPVDAGEEPQGFAIKNIEFSRIKVKQL